MADFEYAFASSGTPTSFTIGKTGITGIDEAGTLTPKIIRLSSSVNVLTTGGETDASIVALMKSFLQRHNEGHDGAGGFPTQPSLQETPAETNVGAAD